MLAASRVLLERVRDALDPTAMLCDRRGCTFSDERRRRHNLPPLDTTHVTPFSRTVAALLQPVVRAIGRQVAALLVARCSTHAQCCRRPRRADRPTAAALRAALHDHVLCDACARADEQLQTHLDALRQL